MCNWVGLVAIALKGKVLEAYDRMSVDLEDYDKSILRAYELQLDVYHLQFCSTHNRPSDTTWTVLFIWRCWRRAGEWEIDSL